MQDSILSAGDLNSHRKLLFQFDHSDDKYLSGWIKCYYVIAFPLVLLRIAYLIIVLISFVIILPIAIAVKLPSSFISFMLQVFSRLILAAFGIFYIQRSNVHIGGSNLVTNNNRGPTHLICNHVNGHLDGFIVLALFGTKYALVANTSISNIPILGSIFKSLNWIFVNQHHPSGISTQISLCKHPIAIFAEGGTTNGKALMKFRSGAFHTTTQVSMLAIQYPKNYAFRFSLAARGEVLSDINTAMRYFLLVFAQPFHPVKVKVIARYNIVADNAIVAGEEVRQAFSKACEIPCSRFFYRDYLPSESS